MTLIQRVNALANAVGIYVKNSILPRLLPVGGTTGQVLGKTSGTNYASSWVNNNVNFAFEQVSTLPVTGILGQVLLLTTDNMLYRWGNANDLPNALGWVMFGQRLPESAFDEQSGSYNVPVNSFAMMQMYTTTTELVMYVNRSDNRIIELNITGTTTAFPVETLIEQDTWGLYALFRLNSYIIKNTGSPRAVIVSNKENLITNQTIPLMTGDVLIPQYISSNNSWAYIVIPNPTKDRIITNTYTSSANWTKPASLKCVKIVMIAGGGGGGSGRKSDAGVIATGGAGGSAGGCVVEEFGANFLGADGTDISVTVGSGGQGGAAVSTASNNGNTGSAGGSSIFGNFLTATGGAGGGGGAVSAPTAPAVGTGYFSGTAGGISTTNAAGNAGNANIGSGTWNAATGGGGGGSVTVGNSATSGGAGGTRTSGKVYAGGIAGFVNVNGNNAGSGINSQIGRNGTGGGGGAAAVSGSGGNGGNGGNYGAGGGGGGAARDSAGNSGKGGNGAGGIVIVIEYY